MDPVGFVKANSSYEAIQDISAVINLHTFISEEEERKERGNE